VPIERCRARETECNPKQSPRGGEGRVITTGQRAPAIEQRRIGLPALVLAGEPVNAQLDHIHRT